MQQNHTTSYTKEKEFYIDLTYPLCLSHRFCCPDSPLHGVAEHADAKRPLCWQETLQQLTAQYEVVLAFLLT